MTSVFRRWILPTVTVVLSVVALLLSYSADKKADDNALLTRQLTFTPLLKVTGASVSDTMVFRSVGGSSVTDGTFSIEGDGYYRVEARVTNLTAVPATLVSGSACFDTSQDMLLSKAVDFATGKTTNRKFKVDLRSFAGPGVAWTVCQGETITLHLTASITHRPINTRDFVLHILLHYRNSAGLVYGTYVWAALDSAIPRSSGFSRQGESLLVFGRLAQPSDRHPYYFNFEQSSGKRILAWLTGQTRAERQKEAGKMVPIFTQTAALAGVLLAVTLAIFGWIISKLGRVYDELIKAKINLALARPRGGPLDGFISDKKLANRLVSRLSPCFSVYTPGAALVVSFFLNLAAAFTESRSIAVWPWALWGAGVFAIGFALYFIVLTFRAVVDYYTLPQDQQTETRKDKTAPDKG